VVLTHNNKQILILHKNQRRQLKRPPIFLDIQIRIKISVCQRIPLEGKREVEQQQLLNQLDHLQEVSDLLLNKVAIFKQRSPVFNQTMELLCLIIS
jgi:hypothetical protein